MNPLGQSLLSYFQPNSTMDMIGRFFTPGATAQSSAQDPFAMQQIMSLFNPQPQQQVPGGMGYAQQMAGQYGDTDTAASTIGVKSQKANKIKKAKR